MHNIYKMVSKSVLQACLTAGPVIFPKWFYSTYSYLFIFLHIDIFKSVFAWKLLGILNHC